MKNFSLLIMVMLLAGCTTTQQGTSIGTVAGAALGGIIGHQSGNAGQGAAIGAAAGGLGGYAVGKKIGEKKFCPTGGKAYDESLSFCPVHGVELKYKEK